jgi:hypothetical protein
MPSDIIDLFKRKYPKIFDLIGNNLAQYSLRRVLIQFYNFILLYPIDDKEMIARQIQYYISIEEHINEELKQIILKYLSKEFINKFSEQFKPEEVTEETLLNAFLAYEKECKTRES